MRNRDYDLEYILRSWALGRRWYLKLQHTHETLDPPCTGDMIWTWFGGRVQWKIARVWSVLE